MFTETLHRSFRLMPTYNGRRDVRHLSDDARHRLVCRLVRCRYRASSERLIRSAPRRAAAHDRLGDELPRCLPNLTFRLPTRTRRAAASLAPLPLTEGCLCQLASNTPGRGKGDRC
jgi:hypothetical protein